MNTYSPSTRERVEDLLIDAMTESLMQAAVSDPAEARDWMRTLFSEQVSKMDRGDLVETYVQWCQPF